MSVGNVTQEVSLSSDGLTLVLGENLDLGGTNSRNGVGKSTILQAISFGLFGVPLTNIKKDNLVNSTNLKNMAVNIEFEKDGNKYRIERGRKPAFMRYLVNDGLVNQPDADEAQGDSRNTQIEIEKVLGISHTLFCHIVAMSTYTDPFLKLRPGEQRELIEELLGITVISARSDALKEIIKSSKEALKEEEIRNKATQESNNRIQRTINDLISKSDSWERDRTQRIDESTVLLTELQKVDSTVEVDAHETREMYDTLTAEINRLTREKTRNEKDLNRLVLSYEKTARQLEATKEHQCHECGQTIHSEKHAETLTRLTNELSETEHAIVLISTEVDEMTTQITDTEAALLTIGSRPETVYGTLKEALNHKSMLTTVEDEITRETNATNPYTEQVTSLESTGMKEINLEVVEELTSVLKHQELLFKLLTNKDSFIRKKIIDQNINHLNHRLNFYLEKLNLPHEVKFKSDLSVEITLLGKDFDYEQLSRGEMTRVNLATSWSFRDIFENLCFPINLLFIDEFLDSGLDTQGSEAALDLLKTMARERMRNVYLISHKEELLTRVSKILKVTKENRFTSFTFTESNS